MNEMTEEVQRARTLLFLGRLRGLEKSPSARSSGLADPLTDLKVGLPSQRGQNGTFDSNLIVLYVCIFFPDHRFSLMRCPFALVSWVA